MLNFLRTIYSKIDLNNNRKKIRTRNQMEKFLSAFDEPTDDIERSYYQYCCQQWLINNKIMLIISNVISMFLYLPFFIYFKLRNRRKFEREEQLFIATNAMILQSIPESYANQCFIPDFNEGMLTKNDSEFLNEITRRYPYAFYFRFKIMCRVANYSYIIRKYSPKTIFCSAEYSYTSSILTLYCERRNITHSNAMHGEKWFYIGDAFSRFTYFYVWDEFYKKLFLSMRADKTEYVIRPLEVPQLQIEHVENHYTYYLQDQTVEQMKVIKSKFEMMNVDYIVRPHPRYCPKEVASKVFDEKHIERNEIDIWDSIRSAGHVVSSDSTVNYQAYLVGVEVVLDDISNPKRYQSLLEKEYIMLQKLHVLFSELK